MASCTNQCNVSCTGTPPSATCDAQCMAGCNGSCNVQANFSCQASATAGCTGGCMTACSAPQGALFCDFGNGLGPQYVDVPATGLPDCEAALASMLSVNVSGGIQCTNGDCTAGVSAGGCDASGGTAPVAPIALFTGLGLFVATMVRRRKA
jgi:MYXO-CTERM domain-containing protein